MRIENSRLLKALRLAFYPAFEPPEAKRFQALTREAQEARNAGDLARAEQIYLRAMAEAEASSDPHLNFIRSGLAHVYQEQRKYREAERIFRERLEEALKSPGSNTDVHAAHMALARLYQAEGKTAKAEEHYRAGLAETEKPDLRSDRDLYFSTALWLARFYVEQHRYSDAEPVFKRALEGHEANRPSDSSLPHYLHEFAKVYEAQEKYAEAEELYRRALVLCERLETPADLSIVRALDELAQFCNARGRYAEAEDLSRRSLALVEEKIDRHTAASTKGWTRWSNREQLEARIKHARVPIGGALDRLAEIYERQGKYAESAPLRKRSFEIQQQAYGEANSWLWVDSLDAYANALRKMGQEDEAAKLEERVGAIRAQYSQGSVRSFVQLRSMPVKRTLRGRFGVFINALLHPSSR